MALEPDRRDAAGLRDRAVRRASAAARAGPRRRAVRTRLTAAGEAAHAYLAPCAERSPTTAPDAGPCAARPIARSPRRAPRSTSPPPNFPPLARHTDGTDEVAVTLERLVDTTTACAVHLDDTGRVPEQHAERIDALLAELAA